MYLRCADGLTMILFEYHWLLMHQTWWPHSKDYFCSVLFFLGEDMGFVRQIRVCRFFGCSNHAAVGSTNVAICLQRENYALGVHGGMDPGRPHILVRMTSLCIQSPFCSR